MMQQYAQYNIQKNGSTAPQQPVEIAKIIVQRRIDPPFPIGRMDPPLSSSLWKEPKL
jgi:hypothetical protein